MFYRLPLSWLIYTIQWMLAFERLLIDGAKEGHQVNHFLTFGFYSLIRDLDHLPSPFSRVHDFTAKQEIRIGVDG